MQSHDDVDDEVFYDSEDESVSLPIEAYSPCKRAQMDPKNSGNYAVGPPVPIPQLMSRPPIDFSSRHSASGYPSSQVSGSTLYSRSNPFMAAHKAPTSFPSPRMHADDIASLTEAELLYNPFHSKLRRDFDNISITLAKYLNRDLSVPHVSPSPAAIQGM